MKFLTDMKRIFGHLKLSETQKVIIDSCINENEDEYSQWYFLNLITPIVFLVISAFIILFIKDFEDAFLAMLNGSLSIIGISIICSMSSYLIGKKDIEDKFLNKEVVNLSKKLSNHGYLVIAFGAILYATQVAFLPTEPKYYGLLFILVLIVLFLSVKIGVRSFIIRDDFYENSMEKIYERAKDTKRRMSEVEDELRGEAL